MLLICVSELWIFYSTIFTYWLNFVYAKMNEYFIYCTTHMITRHCIHSKNTALIYLLEKKRKQKTSTRFKKQQHYFELMKVICSFKRHFHWFSNAVYVDFFRNIWVSISPIYIYFIICTTSQIVGLNLKVVAMKEMLLLAVFICASFPSYLFLLLFVFNFCHILTDTCKLLLHLHCIANCNTYFVVK